MIFKFSSISNTKGVPVGKFKSRIFSSEIFNKYLINALKLFPWAEIRTFLPALICLEISLSQYGSTRSIVSFKLSPVGISFSGISLYLSILPESKE